MSSYETQLLSTSARHSHSLVHSVDNGFHSLGDFITRNAWSPLCNIARSKALEVLREISQGELTVLTNGESHTFGTPFQCPTGRLLKATVTVRNESFWTRLALFGDLGFAEAYMDGEIDCDELSTVLHIFIANRKRLDGLTRSVSSLLAVGRWLTSYKFLGDISTSRANISAHYDLGNTMFTAYLSQDMNYSSAIFRDIDEDLKVERIGTELEHQDEAHLRKMYTILGKLRLQPGDRLLEFGTGWGALSILAASTVDCTIDTLTLSSEQYEKATERIRNAGLSDKIRVYLMDYRDARKKPEWKAAFDKLVTIEMIEHVGKEFIDEFWAVADWALKDGSDGRAVTGVLQFISMPESRVATYDSDGADFIQKWVFPGCYIPSVNWIISTMASSTSGRLTVDSVMNIGPHYARTLREWKAKFLTNWEGIIKKALQDQHSLDEDGLEVFKRRWLYYFDYCEAGFSTRSLGDHIITYTRECNVGFGCDVEIRDVPRPFKQF